MSEPTHAKRETNEALARLRGLVGGWASAKAGWLGWVGLRLQALDTNEVEGKREAEF